MERALYAFELCDVADERGRICPLVRLGVDLLVKGPSAPVSSNELVPGAAGRVDAGSVGTSISSSSTNWPSGHLLSALLLLILGSLRRQRGIALLRDIGNR